MRVKSITIRERSTGRLLERRELAAVHLSLSAAQKAGEATCGPVGPRVGLGDRIEKLARPIARVVDRVFGTKLASCGGCKKRRDWLNQIGR